MRLTSNPMILFVVFTLLPITMHAQSTPPSPTSDIPWNAGGQTGVLGIQTAFNNARSAENTQLGTSIPTTFTMPTQAEWNALTNSAKALYLMNAERTARGLLPLQGGDSNLVSVAQLYAGVLVSTGVFSHTADGTTFTQRVNANVNLNGHYEYLSELLAGFVLGTTEYVAMAIHMLLYIDAAASWGHRTAILRSPYNNNYGPSESEGMIGAGVANSATTRYLVLLIMDPKADYRVSVEDGDMSMPNVTALQQNYPNPFNPETVIRYQVSGFRNQSSRQKDGGQAAVSVRVYDLLGHEVAVLVQEEKHPGIYSVTWNARGMPSGIYFCTLQAGGERRTRKLVLLQ